MQQNSYDFITTNEAAFLLPVKIVDNLEWSAKEHINTTILYKNSTYKSGKDDNKPFKNIIRPILNLQYRAEGFDVKDIVLFINDKYKYFKSFLVRKYHEIWARQNDLDTFIDEMVESYVDFGGALVKNVNEIRPEVVPMSRLAFFDQTDLLSGPICEKHFYAPDQLKEMEKKGWKYIDQVITLAREEKTDVYGSAVQKKTPGKYVEVFELHGMFPKWWLDEYPIGAYDESAPENEYIRQLHIVTYYKDREGKKNGICLYKGKEKELPYKLCLRDKIFGRALGFGGAEELFEPQVWVNYDIIRKKEMLDMAAKVIFQTADKKFSNRNKTFNLSQGEILITEEGKSINQIQTTPVNYQLFENSTQEWEQHARQMGAATESIMGESPTAGTPFKLQELITAESHSLHEYRKGEIATFLGEIYRDWIIPHIAREITAGKEFLAKLDLEELHQVADALADCEANRIIKESLLKGILLDNQLVETIKAKVKENFMKGGDQRFLEILAGELKGLELDVQVNIVGKQANLAQVTDKLTNVFRTILANPAILQNPPMAKLFNEILESSGLSPVDFYGFQVPQQQLAQPQPQQVQNPTERPSVAQTISNA